MGNDFLSDRKFNYGSERLEIQINLPKHCYLPGETMSGTFFIKSPSPQSFKNTTCFLTITEIHHYQFTSFEKDPKKIRKTDESILLSLENTFPSFINSDLSKGVSLPFSFELPLKSYPSVIFGTDSFVRHFFSVEFQQFNSKKSIIFIAKNNPSFTKENSLLKTPSSIYLEETKHKYAVFFKGKLTCKSILEKNCFQYNEEIPIEIQLDCTGLNDVKITAVIIQLIRNKYKKLSRNENDKDVVENKSEVIMKQRVKINHKKGESKIFKINTKFNFPKTSGNSAFVNPFIVYYLIEEKKGIQMDIFGKNKDFKNFRLCPACEGGLLNVRYYLKVILETNTLFSTNEHSDQLQLDFYSGPTNKVNNNANNINNNINNEIADNNFINDEEIKEIDDMVEKNDFNGFEIIDSPNEVNMRKSKIKFSKINEKENKSKSNDDIENEESQEKELKEPPFQNINNEEGIEDKKEDI